MLPWFTKWYNLNTKNVLLFCVRTVVSKQKLQAPAAQIFSLTRRVPIPSVADAYGTPANEASAWSKCATKKRTQGPVRRTAAVLLCTFPGSAVLHAFYLGTLGLLLLRFCNSLANRGWRGDQPRFFGVGAANFGAGNCACSQRKIGPG